MKPSIRVTDLRKQYKLGSAGGWSVNSTLREKLTDSFTGMCRSARAMLFRRKRAERKVVTDPRDFWALKGVSFEAHRGEMIGVIGHNGAGKSTLLKILSRITEPTSGRAELSGQVSSLLEVGTGFHPELTGRENIFMNGAILGMSRHEIMRKLHSIISFAELEPFIDTPVKRYSSGMYVRLAFAVSAHLSPNILLLDEVLAVGDLAFQRKCIDHARTLRDRDATIMLVSHNMFAIKAVCNRVIYLSQGQIVFDGAPEAAIQQFEQDSRLDTPGWAQGKLQEPLQRRITFTNVELLNEGGERQAVFEHGERIRIRLHYTAPQPLDSPNVNVSFIRSDQVCCCNFNTLMDRFALGVVEGPGVIELLTPPLLLTSEMYTVHALVWDTQFKHLYNVQVGGIFHVRHPVLSSHFGVFHESAEWSVSDGASLRE